MNGAVDPADDRVDILLATYNGERFLAEQLDSIVAQTHSNWRIIARDDGSSDGTVEILKAFQVRHPDKVSIINDGDGNLGLVQNFSQLMEHSNAPYAAFCDQDDVWKPEKLEMGLRVVKALEREWGAETPSLCFSDLEVVDSTLNPVAPSFWRYQGLFPERASEPSRLLSQNVVTGCTAVINRSLAKLAAPIPQDAVVHDWWIALVAAAFGYTTAVRHATVLYRQHGDNDRGAPGYHLGINFGRLCNFIKSNGQNRPPYAQYYRQAVAFHARFQGRLSSTDRQVLETFIDLPNAPFISRSMLLARRRYLPTGLFRMLSLMIYFNR